jgi:hypothetical protein
MFARNLIVLVAGAGLSLGVAACSDDMQAGSAPPATTAATTAAASAPANPAVSAPAAKPVSSVASSSCPVSAATLGEALKKQAPKGLGGAKLSQIKCYQGYAFGSTPDGPVADGEQILFKFTSGSWTYVGGGSGGYCTSDLPADVEKHFGCN